MTPPSPPPEKAWPEELRISRGGGSVGTTYWVREIPGFSPADETYIRRPPQQQGGVEEAVAEFEADARRCEEKRDRDGRAGNVDSEAYNQGKGHAYQAAADYLRSAFDLPAPQQGGEGS